MPIRFAGAVVRDPPPWCVPLALTVALLGACGKKHEAAPSGAPPAAKGTPAPSGFTTGARLSGATLANAGQVLDGSDPDAIRAYLQSVKEIKPTRFSVKWSPDTVAIGKDEALRSLRSISEDGTVYRLAASEAAVQKIKPGSVLWIYDIALRRVTSVATIGDETVVITKQIPINQALVDADIAFESPVSLPDFYVGMRPHLPRNQRPSALVPRARASLAAELAAQGPLLKTATHRTWAGFLLPARYESTSSDTPPAPAAGADASGEDDTDPEDYGEVPEEAPVPMRYPGEIMGFEYVLGVDASPTKLSIELEASKKQEGATTGAVDESMKSATEKYEKYLEEARTAKKEMQSELREEVQVQRQMDSVNEKLAEQGTRQGPAADRLKDQLSREQTKLATIQHNLSEAEKTRKEAIENAKKLSNVKDSLVNVFGIINDNFDVRFRTKVDMDQFALAGVMMIKDGRIQEAASTFKNVKGHLALEFIGRLGEKGDGVAKVPVAHLPIQINEPLPLYGIPFVLQVGADFLATVALYGHHATMHFVGDYDFSGNGGLQATHAQTDAIKSMSATEAEFKETEALTPGASGLVLGLQMPRLGLGIGVFGANAMSYIDAVTVLTITSAAAVATLNPVCKRVTLAEVGHVGVDVNLMPIPIPLVANKANDALSQKQEIFHVDKVRTDPPIKMCQI
ncbi:MAG TPA: hypothetical protein VKT22_05560 [Steroidobacteraceae bacterium]|nr:hypothetical protein [Steroidobacteraceae bacterium]